MATGGKMISMKKLPVGYRLNPSDEDLVNHHLKRKLLNIQEEYCLIPEFDIYKLPPWDLITKFNELSDLASDGGECFFYHRRGNPNSKRNNRRTKEGFWKVTGEGRKPQETDRTKWRKRILVFYLGKQKSAVKSDWAMHEWENPSDPSIVVCHIHKIKLKKGKVKVDSVSSEDCSNRSPGATVCSGIHIEPQETSPEASMNIAMESQNLTPTSIINLPDFSTASQQTVIVADSRSCLSEETHTNSIYLGDLEDLQDHPLIFTREQSSCSGNASINGCDQGDSSWLYSGDVTLGEGVNMFMFCQTSIDQSLDYVLLGSVSPPQQPQMMPTEEIYPLTSNTSFNGSGSGSGSGVIYPQLDIHGHGAQLLSISMKYGSQETNFKEAPQSPNSIPTREQSPCSKNTFIHGCDKEDGSWSYHGNVTLEGGGNMFTFDRTSTDQPSNYVSAGFVYPPQQPQMMPMEGIPLLHLVTRDSATESPAATEDSEIDSMLDSFFASSPPYASGGTFEKCNPEMCKGY